jgi:hypothetical protein
MAIRSMIAIARVVAFVLVGAGIAGVASLAGVGQLGLFAGVIALGIGGVFVLVSNQASWLPLPRRVDDADEPVGGLFGMSYGLAAVVGLLGGGLVIGSTIDSAAVLFVVGLAGLVALALLPTAHRGPT